MYSIVHHKIFLIYKICTIILINVDLRIISYTKKWDERSNGPN